MKLHADLRPITVQEKGRFKPGGPIQSHGARPHIVSGRRPRVGTQLLSARFLVGFNVHGRPHWTEDDLIRFFIEVRERQGRSSGASFLTQRGIWQPLGGRREPDEQGAQIIILNEDGLDEETFVDEMAALGEELARLMDQDAIYLDIQKVWATWRSVRPWSRCESEVMIMPSRRARGPGSDIGAGSQ